MKGLKLIIVVLMVLFAGTSWGGGKEIGNGSLGWHCPKRGTVEVMDYYEARMRRQGDSCQAPNKGRNAHIVKNL